MKISQWFDSWEWLKCSGHDWNFARFVAWQLFIVNTVGLITFAIIKNGFADFNNVWSAVVGCSGYLTGCIIYFVEIFCRERIKIKVSVGKKNYGIENDGK